ncbi:Mismatch repair protein MutS-like ATPase [Polaribacter irgensii 23-P]|uniref:Mismatch repair protein MutS-like ATPase n=1 Tax=Polaribacter irgensii 23-P TaxID=313594 RepID=A4BZM7_9FLAO|nr:DNA mismatch repair protein MutS [Polaribacter irgensii]EAR12620.1 Mismatch repair protein MutS-like ATPase [Polaribacter irgensii 23-P]
MNWILGVIIILILRFLLSNYRKKKNIKKTKNNLLNNWSKQKSQDEFHFVSIEKYFNSNNQKKDAFHLISDRCATDLDINETFKIIDRTSSKIGQQYLYYKVRTIQNKDKLQTFSNLTLLFEENEDLRLKAQLNLTSLNSNDSYSFESLITSQPIAKPKIIWLIYTLSILSITFIFLGFLFPIFFIFLIPVFTTNMLFHYKNKWEVSNYINGVTQLSKALIVSKNLISYPKIKNHFNNASFIKEIEKISLKTTFISFEKKVDNEFAIAFWIISELIKVLFNFEYIIFYSFIDSITKRKEDLKNLFHFIGEIDSAISSASLKASEYELCEPTFVEEKELVVKDIYHPLIKNCIVNDLDLLNKSLLLTGSNMSGKTTFIRSISINSVLAQTINICFAKEYVAPFFKLYSSIRITDDILENTSYYLEEVLTIKKLIDASNSQNPCLFVLDEIFKGTNTIERISGGKAILSYLNKGNNVVLVSTHDIELTDILSIENFELFHFSEEIENNELTFEHKLKEGKLKTRNAIKILELYNYPKEMIEDARETEKITFANTLQN